MLVSYPAGFAVMADLKRNMAILATSGWDCVERTKRLASACLNWMYSQCLVEQMKGGWRITDKGRVVREIMEARPAPAKQTTELLDVCAVE